jgi:hypothetical protein
MPSLRALLVVTVGVAAAIPAHAQAPGLQLTLQAERPVVELGEPVYVTARVANRGSAPIAVRPLLDPRDGQLSISVQDPAGEGVGYMPLAVRDNAVTATPLAPGAQVAKTVPIFFGATGWVFKVAGKYTVRARFESHGTEGRRIELAAAPITIEVRDGPATVRDLMAGGEASLQAGRFLEWRSGDQLADGRALLERVTAEQPQSALASHYRLAEARSWARPFKDYRAGQVRPADPQRALAALERVREDVLPPALVVEKRLTQASALLAANRPKEAAELLERTAPAFGERAELVEFREPLQRLQAAARSTGQRQ